MITLNYTRMADAMGDHEALRFAERLKRSFDSNAHFDVSNELVILAVRVLVAEGKHDVEAHPIMLQYEGKDVGTIGPNGEMPDMPLGFCDSHETLKYRGIAATAQRKISKMGEDFQRKYLEKFNEWIKDTVMEIITPGTVFYLAPDAAGAPSIKHLEQRQKFTAGEWILSEEDGMYYLDVGKGHVPAPALVEVCYDTYGDKYITVPFNSSAALASLGIKPEAF